MQEAQVQSLSQEDPCRRRCNPLHILAWEILWTAELAGYNPCGLKKAGHNLVTTEQQQLTYSELIG